MGLQLDAAPPWTCFSLDPDFSCSEFLILVSPSVMEAETKDHVDPATRYVLRSMGNADHSIEIQEKQPFSSVGTRHARSVLIARLFPRNRTGRDE